MCERGDRGERRQHDELLPHRGHDPVGEYRRELALLELCRDCLCTCRARAVQLAEDENAEIAHVLDVPFGRKHRPDVAAAAHDALLPEALPQGLQVQEPVQHGDDHGLGPHRRRDRVERRRQVVGFAGEQDDVVGALDFAREHRLDFGLDVAGGALDHQALLGEALLPLWPHQEGYIGARLGEPSAEIAADCARTQHQDPHRRLRSHGPIPARDRAREQGYHSNGKSWHERSISPMQEPNRPMSSAQTSATPTDTTAAEVLLRALKAHGIDYFFANPGTDFAPIVEAFARSRKQGTAVPQPMVIPHENTAVSMAHGVYMMTGHPQAVMVHTTVGTGNTLNTLINASRDHVPMMLLAGRTPVTEGDVHGARSRHIHWAQEMFDQAGLVREVVKWDYELRTPEQAADVVARAMEIMMASPPGPAYLMLPREVLGGSVRLSNAPLVQRAVPATPYPDPHAIVTLAEMIVAAERPVIVAANSGSTPGGLAALANLAEHFALPVISY